MDDNKKTKIKIKIEKIHFIGIIIILTIIGIGILIYFSPTKEIYSLNIENDEYNQFAKCLNEKGAIFYGAFWCSHCENQKELFGSSEKYLNYVECSLPDKRGQTQICIDENITSYPTWKFEDKSIIEGPVNFDILIRKTGCQINTEL